MDERFSTRLLVCVERAFSPRLARSSPHSAWYVVLNGHAEASRGFNRALAALIVATVFADVASTVDALTDAYGWCFDAFEVLTSVLFAAEYAARFYVAGERLKHLSAEYARTQQSRGIARDCPKTSIKGL